MRSFKNVKRITKNVVYTFGLKNWINLVEELLKCSVALQAKEIEFKEHEE